MEIRTCPECQTKLPLRTILTASEARGIDCEGCGAHLYPDMDTIRRRLMKRWPLMLVFGGMLYLLAIGEGRFGLSSHMTVILGSCAIALPPVLGTRMTVRERKRASRGRRFRHVACLFGLLVCLCQIIYIKAGADFSWLVFIMFPCAFLSVVFLIISWVATRASGKREKTASP